jgi:hypothetical protein
VVRVKRSIKGGSLFGGRSSKVGPSPGNGPPKPIVGNGPPKPIVGRWVNGPLEPRQSRATPTSPGFSSSNLQRMRQNSKAFVSRPNNHLNSVGNMFAKEGNSFGYNTVSGPPKEEGPYAGLGPDRKLYGSAGKPVAGEKPYNTIVNPNELYNTIVNPNEPYNTIVNPNEPYNTVTREEGKYMTLGNLNEGEYMGVGPDAKVNRSPSGNSGYRSNGIYNSVV